MPLTRDQIQKFEFSVSAGLRAVLIAQILWRKDWTSAATGASVFMSIGPVCSIGFRPAGVVAAVGLRW